MITQETKLVKTWGGFNLAILKVNLNPLSWKNRNLYNKTYKPLRSTSYCYLPVELTDTTMCKFRIHGLLLSCSPPDISTPAYVSLGLNGNNWIDHQGVENFFSLKTLSLCEGKLLKDRTKIHINRNMSNTKMWLGFAFYTQVHLENPKRFN